MFSQILKVLFIGTAILAVGALVLISNKPEEETQTTTQIFLPNTTLTATILDTDASREKGLSGLTGLKKDKAVIMVFNQPGRYGIWMKEMDFPIDVIWLNQDKKIVHLVSNMTPDSYPKTFIPPLEAQFIIEANVGTIAKNNLKVGETVRTD